MADATSSGIVDGNSSNSLSGQSDRGEEVIEKLFPKCHPKIPIRIPRSSIKVSNRAVTKSRESSNSSEDSLPISTVKVSNRTVVTKSRESSNSSGDSFGVSTSTQEGDDGKVPPASLADNCATRIQSSSSLVNNNSFKNNHISVTNNFGHNYSSHNNTSDLNLYLLSFSPIRSSNTTIDTHMTTDNVNMNNECKPGSIEGVHVKNMNGGGGEILDSRTLDASKPVERNESKNEGNCTSDLQNRVDNVLFSPTEETPNWGSKKHFTAHPSSHNPSYHSHNSHHRVPSYRRSKQNHRHKNILNKVMIHDDDDSRDDSMRDDSSSPSLSLRSNPSHRKGKKCKRNSGNKFKVRSVPVSSEEDIAIKMSGGTGDVMDTDSVSSSPGQEPEIARVIGNIPIPLYEGSPRRYGPKQPGSSQRVFPNEYEKESNEKKEEEEEGESGTNSKEGDSLDHDLKPAFIDISCDELVKSILSIPLPSALETSSADSSSKSSAALDRHSKDITFDSKEIVPKGIVDPGKELYGRAEDEMCSNGKPSASGKENETEESRKSEASSGSTVNPKVTGAEDAVTSRENELILLHQRVHQHLLQELTSGPFHSSKTCAKDHLLSKSGPSKNFTLSPETTDCDSNEVESEYSLSSGPKLIHLPILEDGLSSGLPSPDTEYDDPVLLTSGKDRPKCDRQRIKKSGGGNQNGSVPAETRGLRSGSNYNAILPSEPDQRKQGRNTYINHKASPHISHHDDQIPLTGMTGVELENHGDEEDGSSPRFLKDPRMVPSSSKMRRSRSLQLSSDSIGLEDETKLNDSQQVVSNDSSPQRQGKPIDQTEVEGGPSHPTDENNKLIRSRSGKNHREDECDTDQETDRLLGAQRDERPPSLEEKGPASVKRKNASREVRRHDPKVLIEGVLFRARYLGSTQLICEGQPTKATRMMQAEEAVSRIKAPEGETQPSTEVDLFISTEKIMVLNTDLKEIMMDHSLRTISYIADIGDLLVLMARRRLLTPGEEKEIKRIPKMICHVFESEEAQFIAQSIGQAFQVAYMEFLKANGIEDSSFVKEMDYQEVLNSQEIFGDELEMFAKKDRQKEVIVPKQKNEILGMVIVESGWGSMLPTVVIANMAPGSPSARCGHLNIGDQIIAINGVSLVGLPLSTCQTYVKSSKAQTAVKLTVVPCAPVVEVKIKRPDTKYQLGFSVQNGVICSLLRGGIAERGGVRVGHRIIEINGQSVVAVPHERIVNLLATSVGEITMKTMPTSMFRLLTGQEAPQYM